MNNRLKEGFANQGKYIIVAILVLVFSFLTGCSISSTSASNPKTVEQYIEILEQSFIIFRLNPYTLNKRTWIKKLKKIYFRDLWIRNAVINNLNPLNLRNDVWCLRENYAIVELIKNMKNKWEWNNYYFWRDGKSEVDLLISKNWELHWYEFKYAKDKWKNLKFINEKIKLDSYHVVNNKNIFDFL